VPGRIALLVADLDEDEVGVFEVLLEPRRIDDELVARCSGKGDGEGERGK
jgi:hypothetical protein